MGKRPITPAIIVGFMGILGVVLAYIEKTLYDRGVGVTALSTAGLTLTGLMVLTIVVFILFGAIIAMAKA